MKRRIKEGKNQNELVQYVMVRVEFINSRTEQKNLEKKFGWWKDEKMTVTMMN